MLYLFSRKTVKGSVHQGVLLAQNSGSCFCEVVYVDQCALLFAYTCLSVWNPNLGRYLQRWELDAALDVLTMCSCHLSCTDPIHLEVYNPPPQITLIL